MNKKQRIKNIALLFIVLIASCTLALAQQRTFGGRIGYSIGASGQYNIGKKKILQIDIDLLSYRGAVQSTVTYNWLFPIKSWKNSELNIFTGVGVGGGYCWRSYYEGYGIVSEDCEGRFWFVGSAGNLGLELNFQSGLQLLIDWRPLLAPVFYKDGWVDYFIEGLFIGACAIGVRYKFKK